jgi:hypothetical protein
MLNTAPPRPIATVTAADGSTSRALPIARIDQAESEWCWAACGEMIAKSLGLAGISQCVLANSYLAGTAYCVDACKDSSKCDYACAEDAISTVYTKAGIRSNYVASAVDPTVLASEIAGRKRPVLAMLHFNSGSSHVVLLTGYSPSGGVYVLDTRLGYGEGWVDYTVFRQAHGYGSWIRSWTGIDLV